MALGLAIVWPLAQPLVGSGLALGLALRLALGWLWPGPWLTFGLTLGLAPVLALGWLFAWAMAGTWGRIRNQGIYPAEYVWLDTFNQISGRIYLARYSRLDIWGSIYPAEYIRPDIYGRIYLAGYLAGYIEPEMIGQISPPIYI